MAAVFEALGDPTRRRILELLSDGEQAVGTLVAALGTEAPISQPAVSQHLKVLRDGGLVAVRAEGTRRLYAIDRDGLRPAVTWLTALTGSADRLDQPLDALATEVARGRKARRATTATGRKARGGAAEGRSA